MQPNLSRVYFISANLIQAKYVADQVIHLLLCIHLFTLILFFEKDRFNTFLHRFLDRL